MASFGKFRFLTLIKPVLHILPEVAPPDRKIPFKVGACPFSAARRLCAAQRSRARELPRSRVGDRLSQPGQQARNRSAQEAPLFTRSHGLLSR